MEVHGKISKSILSATWDHQRKIEDFTIAMDCFFRVNLQAVFIDQRSGFPVAFALDLLGSAGIFWGLPAQMAMNHGHSKKLCGRLGDPAW